MTMIYAKKPQTSVNSLLSSLFPKKYVHNFSFSMTVYTLVIMIYLNVQSYKYLNMNIVNLRATQR